jgi:AraC-like DNA-binding protein
MMPAPPPRAQVVFGRTEATRWEMARRLPAPHLRAYVRDLCGYTEHTPGGIRRREFPGAQVVVIFEFGPPVRISQPGPSHRVWRFPGGFVAGLDGVYAETEHDGFQHGLQVNMTPVGARLFLGLPMSELTGRIVSLRDLLPREHRSLSERLAELPTWDARIDLVERLIETRISSSRTEVDVVSWAYRRIDESGGALDMRTLTRELGYSQKHVIRMFHEHVGVAPKLLARIVRFERLIQHLREGSAGTWADLALEFGYYDQSHLSRDVKEFTGATPTEARGMIVDFSALSADVNFIQDPQARAV